MQPYQLPVLTIRFLSEVVWLIGCLWFKALRAGLEASGAIGSLCLPGITENKTDEKIILDIFYLAVFRERITFI